MRLIFWANDMGLSNEAGTGGIQSSMRTGRVSQRILLFILWTIAMAVAGCSVTGTGRDSNAPLPQVEADSPATAFRVVEGVLLKIEGDVYVVRDVGQDVRFWVTKDTGMDTAPKIGQKVGAEVGPNGFARWVWLLK